MGENDDSEAPVIDMAVLLAAGAGETDSLVAMIKEMEPQVPGASSLSLLYAASSGRLATVRVLVTQCGADVRHVSENGWTATMYAALNGHTEVVIALVYEYSASANYETRVGRRMALMYAASQGHAETAVALAEQCGADLQHEDARGWNAIMYARAAGHSATARSLEASHAALVVAVHRCTPKNSTEWSSHKRKEVPSEALREQTKGDTVVSKAAALNITSAKPCKPNSRVRVIISHLPCKVSTPPPLDQMPPGPCADGGGLWTILESVEVGAD